MAWIGSICDQEMARKAGGSAIIADTDLEMVTGDLTTVAVAMAAATTNNNNLVITHICDRPIGYGCSRGFKIASNMGGTFASTFAVLEASLPDSTNHKRQMITG